MNAKGTDLLIMIKKKQNYGIVMKFYRVMRWFYVHRLRLLARMMSRFIYILFNCSIPETTQLEEEVEIVHGIGIVLHQHSIIGKGTKIYQNVTIGNANGPRIGENCIIGSGACILGDIVVGNNVKIGANAVVLTDIPDNCTAVGVPARIISNKKA